jgi:hypothetical protein
VSSPEDIVCSLELTTSGGDGSGLLRFFVMLEISMRSVCRFRCAVNVDEDSEDERYLCCDDIVLADQKEQSRLEATASHRPVRRETRSGEPESKYTD